MVGKLAAKPQPQAWFYSDNPWPLAIKNILRQLLVVVIISLHNGVIYRTVRAISLCRLISVVSSLKDYTYLCTICSEFKSYNFVFWSIFLSYVYRSVCLISVYREVYSEASENRVMRMCSYIFYQLAPNFDIVPEVLLGNLDNVTSDHTRLSLYVLYSLLYLFSASIWIVFGVGLLQ